MKKHFFLLCVLLLLLFNANSTLPNATMPGYWNTGAGRSFVPLFAADAEHIGKIQMEKEFIAVHLYPGFAVVKGTYFMKNLTADSVAIHTGFPVNGTYSQDVVANVIFNDLYELQVFVDGRPITAEKLRTYEMTYANFADSGGVNDHYGNIFDQIDNFYYWKTTYPPNAITEITVYYIVNTSNAKVTRGYGRLDGCGFTYVLDSGEIWADNIDEGKIVIRLMDNLSFDDVYGVLPEGKLESNENDILLYDFNKLEPSPENNVVIRYAEVDDEFNFERKLSEKDELYSKIDMEEENNINQIEMKPVAKADFEVPDTFFGIPMGVVIGIGIGFAILISAGIFFLVKLIM